jgi:modulator of FtsH protease
MSGWETRIFTGNPQTDHMTVEQHRQAAAAQGLGFDAQPLPGGGYHVRAFVPQGYAQQGYAQQGYGAPAYAAPGAAMYAPQAPSSGGVVVGSVGGVAGAGAAPALGNERVKYLRKVYGLLLLSAVIAIVAGLAAITLGPTEVMRDAGGRKVAVPVLVALMLGSRGAMYGMFALLFVGTLFASAVSKVRGLNLVALLGVSALMGVQAAPMVFVAQYLAGLGMTRSAAPVATTFLMVGAVFAGVTTYAFVTRKDFSYLMATLSMGFWVVFVGGIAAVLIGSEVFTLAIASVGAIIAAGFLLVQTSRILRNSAMDDPVGDCLDLLVQLRNLFIFILRILMSARR